MSSELTEKTMVVVTRSGDFWISPPQAKKLLGAKTDDPHGFTELEDCMVTFDSITGILTAKKYSELNYKRRGGWQCKFQYWHERNQQCAHHLVNSQS